MSELIIKENKTVRPETLSLKSETVAQPKAIKLDRVELSKNIQAFDKKPRVFTANPYGYNTVAKNTPVTTQTPTATQMISTPVYNQVGKLLGVDTVHEWSKYYDKVFEIVEWAKAKTKESDPEKLSSWIYKQLNSAPSMGNKKIDDVYVFSKMGTIKRDKPIVKTVIKTVVKHIKPKETTEQFVDKFMKGAWHGV